MASTGLKIAISGKGGVGKTTLCAVWAHLFSQDRFDVLALDADSDPNLAAALGLSPQDVPVPLIEMKELIQERTGAEPGSYGRYFKLNPKVSDIPETYAVDVNGVKLLVLGSIITAGAGCACPEGAFLKALLAHTLLQRQEVILIDLPAGVEFMGRASVKGVDALVVVVEPGVRSIETALNVAKMARQMGIDTVGAFANKITDPDQLDEISSQLNGLPLIGSYKYDPAVQQADLDRSSVIEASTELIERMTIAKKNLLELFSESKTP